jgi:hypothetical protein
MTVVEKYVALPVPCAGCGKPTPYEVGEDASYGEFLSTPIGDCYVRTHRDRACVLRARARVDGKHIAERVSPEELILTTSAVPPVAA